MFRGKSTVNKTLIAIILIILGGAALLLYSYGL